MVVYQCEACKKTFGRKAALRDHVCEAKEEKRKRDAITFGGWFPVRHGPEPPPPEGWHIATDGSGHFILQNGENVAVAGWGAVVFRAPISSSEPDLVLHAPVVTHEWHHLWMGAREKTNNTGELSAIGEVMHWLLEEAPDDGTIPVEIRFDSFYAANIAQGIPLSWLKRCDN